MLSFLQHRRPEPLAAHPEGWTAEGLDRHLSSLNHRKNADRARVAQHLEILEATMRLEMRAPRFTQVDQVLTAAPESLPIQLRIYRQLHDYLRSWLLH